MSSCLVWEPVVKQNQNDLGGELKFALRKKYGNDVQAILDSSDINYLEGLLHAGINDAQELINAISKHEEIKVYEFYG